MTSAILHSRHQDYAAVQRPALLHTRQNIGNTDADSHHHLVTYKYTIFITCIHSAV